MSEKEKSFAEKVSELPQPLRERLEATAAGAVMALEVLAPKEGEKEESE